MATDQYLIDRIRNILDSHQVSWREQKMFGGDCFMVDDKMCFGTFKGGLLARVGPEALAELSLRPGASQMFQRERPMKGYLIVEPRAYDHEEALEFWITKCLDFNPHAPIGKHKSKK